MYDANFAPGPETSGTALMTYGLLWGINNGYLDKLYEYTLYSDSLMYDKQEGLYYRDARYVYPKHKSGNNKKDFWARGDGWVIAGLAKVLKDLPKDFIHRDFFVNKFKKMAYSLAACQQPQGYWTRSMHQLHQLYPAILPDGQKEHPFYPDPHNIQVLRISS